jgi:hypothetical protein
MDRDKEQEKYKDKRLKYVELRMLWTNKAAKLESVVSAQKRISERMLFKRKLLDEDTKSLLIAVADGYDVTIDLLEYVTATLKEMLEDFEHFVDGAKMRDIIEMQSEIIEEYMDKKNELIMEILKTKKDDIQRKGTKAA